MPTESDDAPDPSAMTIEEIRDVLRLASVPQRVIDRIPEDADGMVAIGIVVVRIPRPEIDTMMVLPMFNQVPAAYLAAVAGQLMATLAKHSPDGFEATLDYLNRIAMNTRELV